MPDPAATASAARRRRASTTRPPVTSATQARVSSMPTPAPRPRPRGRRTARASAPICWPVSAPLPSTITRSPGAGGGDRGPDRGAAVELHRVLGARRRRARARPSPRSRPGSSERGLSLVRTTTSAPRPAAAPISARLAGSRSPPHPNTAMTRPATIARAGAERGGDAVGRVGVVDDHRRPAPRSAMRSNRPGIGATAAMPRAIVGRVDAEVRRGGGRRERVGGVEPARDRDHAGRRRRRASGEPTRGAVARPPTHLEAHVGRRRRSRRCGPTIPSARARPASSTPCASSTSIAARVGERRGEQPRLRREVRVERAVEVEVVTRRGS